MPANITVNYSRWLFGKEAVETGAYLMHPQSRKLDIVGFLLVSWFGEIDYIKGNRFATQMASEYIGRGRTFEAPLNFLMTTSHTDTAEAMQLMELNDDPALSNEHREQAITKFLKKYGIGVSFITGVVEPVKPKVKTSTAKAEMYTTMSGERRFRMVDTPIDFDTDLAAILRIPTDPAEL